MSANLPSAKPWYVCLCKPRREALAVRKLEEQGYEVFLPMLTQWQEARSGWIRKKPQVMFPRYGFVRC
ncbi:MAG: transcription/translation regulatory transformer protein RfaH, partial [Rhodobacteraceae bacterium]|nr:transcription/translation regulatory transformer protein RfaH [Paracoccaceae bacterium]